MSPPADPPLAAAILTAALLLAGAGITLVGALGLLRLPGFFQRVHAPTLGTTLGTACVALASVVHFSAQGGRLAVHELLIVFFVVVTTPISLMVLARAAAFRDAVEREDAAAREPGDARR